MSTERVQIVFSERGAKKVSSEIDKISREAKQTQKSVSLLKKDLSFTGFAIGTAALTGAFVAIAAATSRQEQAVAQLNQGLKTTQGAVGKTSEELLEMASALQKVTTFGDEDFIEAQSKLISFTSITNDVFDKTLELSADLAVRFGTDLKSSVLQLGKALNDPIIGMSALSRSGIQFTQTQKDMVKQLIASGDLLSAQRIVLKELETQFGGSARAARNTFSGALKGLQGAFADLLEADTGGLKGAQTAMEDFTKLLQDPSTVAAVQTLATAIVTAFSKASEAITGTVKVTKFLAEEFAAFVNGPALGDLVRIDEELAHLIASREVFINRRDNGNFIQKFFAGDLDKRIEEVDAAIKEMQALRDASVESFKIDRGIETDTGGAGKEENIASVLEDIKRTEEEIVAEKKRRLEIQKAIFAEEDSLNKNQLARQKELAEAINDEYEHQLEIQRELSDIKNTANFGIDSELAALQKRIDLINRNVEAESERQKLITSETDRTNRIILGSYESREQFIRNEIAITAAFERELRESDVIITEQTNEAIKQRYAELQRDLVQARIQSGDATITEVLFGTGAIDRLFSDFDNIEDNFKALIIQMVAEAAVLKTIELFGGSSSNVEGASLGKGLLTSFANAFAGGAAGGTAGRAGGGRISGGQPFEFGEEGFEALRLDSGKLIGLSGQPGTVVSNDNLKRQEGPTNNVNINFNGINTDFGLQKSARASAQETKRRLDFG